MPQPPAPAGRASAAPASAAPASAAPASAAPVSTEPASATPGAAAQDAAAQDSVPSATQPLATLPMYDHPAVRGATDRFWAGIRDRLRAQGLAVPDALTRPDSLTGTGGSLWPLWQAPGLVLAQTCGLPYARRLHGQVTLVATPDYGLPGCPAGYYTSVFLMRQASATSDPAAWADLRLAYNSANSQSGWAAPAQHMAARGLGFARVWCSGSHAASLQAVTDGQADIAALDAQTWRLLQRHDPLAAAVTEVGRTTPTPGLPFITRRDQDPAPIRIALQDAIAALTATDRAALGLVGLVTIPAAAYLAVPQPPAPPATGHGPLKNQASDA